jgi:hypothetical protein
MTRLNITAWFLVCLVIDYLIVRAIIGVVS